VTLPILTGWRDSRDAFGMPTETLIYKGANGDEWHLEADSEQLFVRHQSSQKGGRSAVMDLNGFVSDGHGPEREALLSLLHEIGYLAP
jgi:hypothetical protein